MQCRQFAPDPLRLRLVRIDDLQREDLVVDRHRDRAFDLVIGAPGAWTGDRLPSAEDLATAYQAARGVALTDFDEHLARASFKLAVIAAGIDHRDRVGATGGYWVPFKTTPT